MHMIQVLNGGCGKMDKKNIIILMVDAFRPKNLSLFGYNKENDKNIKKISRESLFFTNFFSSSNATAPSLTSLFTGKFPENSGIIHQFPYTQTEEIEKFEKTKFWFPELLQKKGYETSAIDWIGSWFERGFDYYKEKDKEKQNSKRFLNSPFIRKKLLNLPSWAYKLGKKMFKTRASPKFCTPEETMNQAIKQMEDAINQEKPFFVFAHFWDTHFPFPTINYKATHKEDIKEALNEIKDEKIKEYFKKRVVDANLKSIEDMIDKYDQSIREIDEQIGKLKSFLEKENLFEKTILIIMGDHGTNLIGHNIYFSSSGLFDDTIHVPFILHLPGFQGKKIESFAQNVDIIPTLLEYLRIEEEINEKIDGISMLPLIKEGKEIRRKVFSWDGLCHKVKSVRSKERKIIIAEDPQCNLCKSQHHEEIEEYDLTKDPGEKKNIYSGTKEEIQKFFGKEVKKEIFKTSESYL
jgi:arylsulfatase A-like enzyme